MRSRVGAGPSAVVVCGGVGASRFLEGLVRVLPAQRITAIVNTADDVERHGLHVSPDVDSVVYRLAGLADDERGWGLRGETWRALEMLRRYGEEAWFQLGDADLGTHLWRSERLRHGQALSTITAAQCAALGVDVHVIPMSDDRVTTRLDCAGFGDLHIQEWFVRERCLPTVGRVRFDGVERARPAPGVLEAVAAAEVLIVAPSNPVISIGPVLAVPGMREALREVPVGVAVTPIVGGEAVRGPAATLLASQGVEVSPAGVAGLYADLIQVMVVDQRDATFCDAVSRLGVRPVVTDTLMVDGAAAARLAGVILEAAGVLPLEVPA